MSSFYKLLDPQKDIRTQTFPIQNALLSITAASQATTNHVSIYTFGPFSGYINTPDSAGSTTAGISPSGSINSITKTFFNHYSAQYFNSASGVYTVPASHSANINVVCGRVIEVADPTRDSGIWPDSFTAVINYYGASSGSITAIDSSADSFGPNKQSLSQGKLTDINNPNHVLGTIFYDYGEVFLHGGTGNVASRFYDTSVTGFVFQSSYSGSLTSSSATTLVLQSLSFRTYSMTTRNLYFCRAFNDEFNFTSNPSAQFVDFLNDENQSTTYITGVGLFDASDTLLAIAKVSPAVRKSGFVERTFIVSIAS